MTEAVAVPEVQEEKPPLEGLNVKELREVCKAEGIKGYANMTKPQIIAAIKEKQVVQVPEGPVALETMVEVAAVAPQPAKEKSWEDLFIAELSKVVSDLDGLPDATFLPGELGAVVERVRQAQGVEDFELDTDAELNVMIQQLRQELPIYHRQVLEVVSHIGKATPIVVEVDFI